MSSTRSVSDLREEARIESERQKRAADELAESERRAVLDKYNTSRNNEISSRLANPGRNATIAGNALSDFFTQKKNSVL